LFQNSISFGTNPFKNSKMWSILRDLQANRRLADNPNPAGQARGFSKIGYRTSSITLVKMSQFQNSVSFGTGFQKSGLAPAFSSNFKVAVPKFDILEQPQIKKR
jgi:hypothetical protein